MEKDEDTGERSECEPEEDEWLMSCRCTSAKAISTLLLCLHHREAVAVAQLAAGARRPRNRVPQLVTVFCNQKCLTFHVHGTSKQFQASVDIQASWFTDYRVAQSTPLTGQEEQEEERLTRVAGSEFCVNLTAVLECLHVLGTAQSLERTQVCMSYNATQEYLKVELLLEDCGVLSTATIPGMIPPDDADDDDDTAAHGLHLAFRSSPIVARMILQSEILRQVVPELEAVLGATVGTVALSKLSGLEIATVGHLGECLLAIPAKGSHIVMLEIQETIARKAKITSDFPLHSLMASFRGLEMAQETCLTINAKGMMAIQHQVLLNASDMPEMASDKCTSTPCFVEFILCCLQDEDDDDDSETREGNDRDVDQQTHMTESHVSHVDGSVYRSNARVGARSVASSTTGTTRSKEAPKSPLSCGDDDEEDESSHLPPTSTNPLFDSLVDQSSVSLPSDDVASFRRRQRRRLGRNTGETRGPRRRKEDDSEDGEEDREDNTASADKDHKEDSDAASRNLLQDEEEVEESGVASSPNQKGGDTQQDDFTQPLDVTAPAASHSPHRRRQQGDDDGDECCSSPEIVYGPQN